MQKYKEVKIKKKESSIFDTVKHDNMKKIVLLAIAVLALASCNVKDNAQAGFEKLYKEHANDQQGVDAFTTLITNFWTPEKSLQEYGKASEAVKKDAKIFIKMDAISHIDDVLPGKPYKEIKGPNALSGDTLCIGDILAQGKPVLVDFWASWCGPCRREIKSHLLDIAKDGKLNIVGIAVWEDALEDTQEAIKALGITWPVIYTGGRLLSPSSRYGVIGIPTLFLIAPDGTILGSGHSVDEIPAIKEYL